MVERSPMNVIMQIIKIFFLLSFLSACTGINEIADDIEKMVDNDAITIKVDKDAFHENSSVKILVEVNNPRF
jgi:hypothetical protein